MEFRNYVNNDTNKSLRILMSNLQLTPKEMHEIVGMHMSYFIAWITGELIMPDYSMRIVKTKLLSYLCDKPIGLKARKTYRCLQTHGMGWTNRLSKSNVIKAKKYAQ